VSAFAMINDHRLTTVSLLHPMYGRWSADVVLADAAMVTNPITLTIGDLTLAGTIFRQASFAGSRSARLVAGAGGWGKKLTAKPYQSDAGIRLSMLLRDAALEVGESIVLDADGTVGNAYPREAAPASQVLRQLGGPLWWIDPSGVTHVGARPSTPITSDFDVIHWSGKTGKFEIATERYSDWVPGRTFTAPTVSGVRTISLVSLEQTNEGKLRLEVLAT